LTESDKSEKRREAIQPGLFVTVREEKQFCFNVYF